MIIWIIEHLFISGVFVIFFLLFFRHEINHQWNRIFLLSSLLLSCVLPWLPSFNSLFGSTGNLQVELPALTVGVTQSLASLSEPAVTTTLNIWWVWTLGSIIYAGVMIRAYLSLRDMTGEKSMLHGYEVRFVKRFTSPFSFINTIYLPSDYNYTKEELDSIMAHESAHIRYGHSWDILTLHLIGCFIWWNPIFYLYKKLIKNIHEYQADAEVIETRDAQDYSRLLWQFATRQQPMHLSHAIFHKPLKNRITMIKRQLQTSRNDLKYLLILPLLALVVFMHACNDSAEQTEPETSDITTTSAQESEVLKVAEVMPRFPGCETEPQEQREKCAKQKLLNYIYTNVQYPEQAKKEGLEGTVIGKFIVSTDGQVYDLDIIKDPGSGMGEEVLRVLKKMSAEHTWTPGEHKGKAANVEFAIPVVFKMQ